MSALTNVLLVSALASVTLSIQVQANSSIKPKAAKKQLANNSRGSKSTEEVKKQTPKEYVDSLKIIYEDTQPSTDKNLIKDQRLSKLNSRDHSETTKDMTQEGVYDWLYSSGAYERGIHPDILKLIKDNKGNYIPTSGSNVIFYFTEDFDISLSGSYQEPASLLLTRTKFNNADDMVFRYDDMTKPINPQTKKAWFDFSSDDYKQFIKEAKIRQTGSATAKKMHMRYLSEASKVINEPYKFNVKDFKDVLYDPKNPPTDDNIVISKEDLIYLHALSTTINRNMHYFYGETLKRVDEKSGYDINNDRDMLKLLGRYKPRKYVEYGLFDKLLTPAQFEELQQNPQLMRMAKSVGYPVYDISKGINTSYKIRIPRPCSSGSTAGVEMFGGREIVFSYLHQPNVAELRKYCNDGTVLSQITEIDYAGSDIVKFLIAEAKANDVDLENLSQNKSAKQQLLAIYTLNTVNEVYEISSNQFIQKNKYNYFAAFGNAEHLYDIVPFPEQRKFKDIQNDLPKMIAFFDAPEHINDQKNKVSNILTYFYPENRSASENEH